nr:MAG TPA: hypothetical protein [Caudoviricetes sp.]
MLYVHPIPYSPLKSYFISYFLFAFNFLPHSGQATLCPDSSAYFVAQTSLLPHNKHSHFHNPVPFLLPFFSIGTLTSQ